jgi:ribonuclease HI
MLKVNWDVAIAQGENQMGVGIIIRDEKGNVIAAISKPVMATHDPATAEALAALRAVEFCREVGAFDINLEGDSLLVVKAICESQTSWTSWLRYGQIIDDIKFGFGVST